MDSLTSLINWLMGVPAGLKLNKPLNDFLGRFFMYHIYLWNSKRPDEGFTGSGLVHWSSEDDWFLFVQVRWKSSKKSCQACSSWSSTRAFWASLPNSPSCRTLSKCSPFTNTASTSTPSGELFRSILLSQSLGQANLYTDSRIYKLEMDSLSSLFRLFRGKKLNPLRTRIDSYLYDVDQLFIGTLGFCVVFFLFPTILMYYIVFLIVSHSR